MIEHFNFKKSLGQNFIVDDNIIRNIVDGASIDKNTLVIEIGPGAGSLSKMIVSRSKYSILYEIDDRLKGVLGEVLKENNNYEVIFRDFLKEDVKGKIKDYDYEKLYVVANLPYYITTPILIKLIEDSIAVDKIVVMVQKEVGDRFKAKPNSKDYSSLSVYLNYYFNVKKLLDVSRNVFMPKPNVDSIVVEFSKKEKVNLQNEQLFFKLVRDSFKQKRKNLKNNLKDYDLEKINKVLNKYNFDLTVRAEQLDINIFIYIANNL